MRQVNRVNVRAYVLAKNEEANLPACLEGLARLGAPIHVLDSGSTDGTARIARACPGVEVSDYAYVDHATAYNEICLGRPNEPAEYVAIVDADMVISSALAAEVLTAIEKRGPAVLKAPILMYWNGAPMRWGSLCPPKAFVFRTGESYFVAKGHGEALVPEIEPLLTRNALKHDDRKPYRAYLETQSRYADALAARTFEGRANWRDRVRKASPLMLLASPLASYVLRGGILDGRTGLIYAVDRLIAEAIMFRRMLVASQDSGRPRTRT